MNLTRAMVVAEIGINHNGDLDLARNMVAEAANAGADAVKFQNYRTEDFLSDTSLQLSYESGGRTITESQWSLFKRCELTRSDVFALKAYCDELGILFLSTPTSREGVTDLIEAGVSHLKNGSDFLGHLPLIRHMGASGLPTILSTGMATEEEIALAVHAFQEAGGKDLILLACTSAYPTPLQHANVRRVATLRKRFRCPSGYSDHTDGPDAAVAAVCLGAVVVEKHFTTDRSLPGPDHRFSATPRDLEALVHRIRRTETALGADALAPSDAEEQPRKLFRLSCAASRACRRTQHWPRSTSLFAVPERASLQATCKC